MSYKILFSSLLLTALSMQTAYADQSITLGVKLLGTGWQGDNGAVSSSFNSDEGGQLAFSASYLQDKFYAGISLQNGEYKFSGAAPDQFTPSGRNSTSNVDIEHREIDLLVGYYFWQQVSLFADIKGVSNTWSNDNYKQNFGGLGFGASGYLALNNDWTGFGSIGFVGRGDIKDDNDVKVGDGTSSALEVGAIYRIDPNNTINLGLKFRNYRFEYLDNTTQDYSINALFFGYNHSFTL
ncbi:MAG TPA: hypothetical protein VIQ03_03750 [Gammaproteobacteria bacterium]